MYQRVTHVYAESAEELLYCSEKTEDAKIQDIQTQPKQFKYTNVRFRRI